MEASPSLDKGDTTVELQPCDRLQRQFFLPSAEVQQGVLRTLSPLSQTT